MTGHSKKEKKKKKKENQGKMPKNKHWKSKGWNFGTIKLSKMRKSAEKRIWIFQRWETHAKFLGWISRFRRTPCFRVLENCGQHACSIILDHLSPPLPSMAFPYPKKSHKYTYLTCWCWCLVQPKSDLDQLKLLHSTQNHTCMKNNYNSYLENIGILVFSIVLLNSGI